MGTASSPCPSRSLAQAVLYAVSSNPTALALWVPWGTNCSLLPLFLAALKVQASFRKISTVVNDPIKFGVQLSPRDEKRVI